MSSPTKLRQMAKELGWPPELEKAADQLQKLKRENAALKKQANDEFDTVITRNMELERENAELRADKERLAEAAEEVLCSYILTMRVELGHPCPENLIICRELRAAIDAAQKEAQS